MIQLENVTKTYAAADGPVHALSEVSLDVASGEFVAVRGPSGCGKSTLLMITGTMAAPSSGSVNVAGEDVLAMSGADRARFRAEKIGFVFQMFHLLPYLTVLENVAAAAADREIDARGRGQELLEAFQLGHRLKHKPAELSAGERQRVAVARALINRPQLILADEPTGNLDADSASAVLDLLDDFHREGGTVLLVTHKESTAERAQRSISLSAGKIATA